MPESVRVALVGCGHNGLGHFECYANDDRCEIVGVCDLHEGRRQAAADDFLVPGFGCVETMLGETGPDLVLVCTGDPFHVEPFVAAAEFGCHVFVEKPMADSIAGLERMLQAAAGTRGQKMMVGQVLRFNPFFAQVKQSCADGTLGRLFYLEADYIHDLRQQADPARFNEAIGMNWYTAREQPAVGGGVHAFDLLRWFAGADCVEVTGYANQIAFPSMTQPDCQVFLAKFANGVLAKVASAYGVIGPRPAVNRLSVYGTAGTVRETDLWLGDGDEGAEVMHFGLGDLAIQGHPYTPEVEHILSAILEDQPVLCDVWGVANATAACILGAESAQVGRPLAVPCYGRAR
ncbi:MAG: Gfo/Idh/MocA family oxidoreductase [Fimbriimonadaceae bacterium]|nr:Gfo/Idh/MocA family oxidoreductase [Fimbriimonadaceae bacterium]